MDIKRVPISTTTAGAHEATNGYLVGDDPQVVIDPAGEHDRLETAISDGSVDHLLVTHTHPDHVGAVSTYASATGVTVWARRGREARFRQATGVEPDRSFRPGESIGETALKALDAPGHAPDHVVFECGTGGPILSGDCVVATGSVVVGGADGDMRAYFTTLRRLYALRPPRLWPGHGPRIDAPRPTIERLLSHRRRREHRVLTAVKNGATTLTEIVDRAYEKDISSVKRLAEMTVRSHLEKLAVEGAITWDGHRAQLADAKRGN